MAGLLRRLTATFVLIAGLFWPWPATASRVPPPADIAYRTLDGRILRASELRGRIVLVDFWATWCAPCLAEMPRLKQLHAGYSREDLIIIGVSLDTTERRGLSSWLRRNGIDWPQVHDARGYNGELARAFGVDRLPATILFDREGRVARRNLRGAALAQAVSTLVLQ
jgi:thiol-disulfide isomerase/thioredoxin